MSFSPQLVEENFDQTSIRSRCLFIQRSLIALRNEYVRMEKGTSRSQSVDEEKIRKDIVEKTLEKIDLTLEELVILTKVSSYLIYLEVSSIKYVMVLKCLKDENAWLHTEIESIQIRFGKFETDAFTAEMEKNHYMTLYHLRKNEVCSKKDRRHESDLDEFGTEVPSHLKAIYNLILEYISQGRYEVALGLAQQAYEEVEKKGDLVDQSVLLNIIALVNREKGDYKAALDALKKTLIIREKITGPSSAQVAAILNNMSVLYGKRGNFEDAEPVCRRAMEIRKKLLGGDHPDVAKQYNNLALILQNMKRSKEIEQLYQSAIQIYNKNRDKHEANLAKSYNNLASYYMQQGKFVDAEAQLKCVLDKWHENLPQRHKQKLYELVEEMSKAKVKPDKFLNTAQRYGKVLSAVYRTSIRYLMQTYKHTKREAEANLINEFLTWCQEGVQEQVHIVLPSFDKREKILGGPIDKEDEKGLKTAPASRAAADSQRHRRSTKSVGFDVTEAVGGKKSSSKSKKKGKHSHHFFHSKKPRSKSKRDGSKKGSKRKGKSSSHRKKSTGSKSGKSGKSKKSHKLKK